MPERLDAVEAFICIKEALPEDRPSRLDALLDLELWHHLHAPAGGTPLPPGIDGLPHRSPARFVAVHWLMGPGLPWGLLVVFQRCLSVDSQSTWIGV